MVIVSAFESPAVVAGLDDINGEAVEQLGHYFEFGLAERSAIFAERQIGDDDGEAREIRDAEARELSTSAAVFVTVAVLILGVALLEVERLGRANSSGAIDDKVYPSYRSACGAGFN